MKILVYGMLLGVIAFLFFQLYRLLTQEQKLQRELTEFMSTAEPLTKENEEISRQLHALQNRANLEREFRRAGYAAPGEKVFIIVPKQ